MFCNNVCLYNMCAQCYSKARSGHQIPLNWSYRWLSATVWVLEIESWSILRAVSTHCISSPLICFFDTMLCKIWAPTSQKVCVAIVFDFT